MTNCLSIQGLSHDAMVPEGVDSEVSISPGLDKAPAGPLVNTERLSDYHHHHHHHN